MWQRLEGRIEELNASWCGLFCFLNRTECPERAGMALATVVETLEHIPEGIRPFYKEVDGKFILDADV